MPTAINKDTGEVLVLDEAGQWVKPATAQNPQTGERLYRDGNEWKPIPLNENEVNAGRAAAVLQGPTFGLGDELVASLENPAYAARSIGSALGIGDAEKEDPEGAKAYETSLNRFRTIERRYREERPVESLALTAGAGLLGGGIGLARGATRLTTHALPGAGRIARAATTGGAFGAVAGFGSGEGGPVERLLSSAFGATLGAGLGSAFEAASPQVSRLWQWLRGRPELFDQQAERLTPTGAAALQEAGIDPRQASVELQREFGQHARDAVNPGQAAAVAQASSLPVPVQLRRGQVSLDPAQQLFESDAAKGIYGQLASNTIRGSEDAQQQALRSNIPAIQARIAGGAPRVSELGQGAQAAQNTLAEMAQTARQRVSSLYQAARQGSASAVIPGQQVSQGVFDISEELSRNGFSRRVAPDVHNIIDDISNLAQRSQQRPSTTIGEIFARRQELSALSRGTPTSQTAAAGSAKASLDRFLNRLIDDDLIRGDPNAVQAWRDAIGARRQFARDFEGDDIVSKLVARTENGRGADLKLDANGAVNLIFGRSETGFTSQSGMVRGLMRMRGLLGQNSPAWNALREEAFLRFARAGEGASGPLGRDFSGANFAKAWENALAKNPGTMRLLFSEAERNLISQFAAVSRRVTTNVRGGNNTSNTGASIAGMVRRLFTSAFMGPKMAAFLDGLPLVKGLANIGYEIRAQNALNAQIARGIRPQPTPRYSTYAPFVAGRIASSNQQSFEK